jgi:hypothetical protein
LLFERFTQLWVKLEREGFRARLEYAIRERPVPDVTTSPSQDGDGGVPEGPVSSPPATA